MFKKKVSKSVFLLNIKMDVAIVTIRPFITYKMNKCECSNSIRPAKVFKFGENIDSLNSLYMDFYIMPQFLHNSLLTYG